MAWSINIDGFNTIPHGDIAGNVFYFGVNSLGQGQSFSSHYFNISQASTNTVSTTTPTSTSLAAETGPNDAVTTSEPAATAGSTGTTEPASSGGLTDVEKAGIGFGVAIGALVLIGAGAVLWRRKMQRARQMHLDTLANTAINEAAAGKTSFTASGRSMSEDSAIVDLRYAAPAVTSPQELDNAAGVPRLHEMDANSAPARELPA